MIRKARLAVLLISAVLSGCLALRLDEYHVFLRSDRITTPSEEREVLRKARLQWTENGAVRVLFVSGTPYERGYQQGVLLRREIRDNLRYLYRHALDQFKSAELFDEAYERMRPFIPQEYVDEMHGLAHGAKLPLRLVHAIHALPEIGEWGGKKKLREVVMKMIRGAVDVELGTSCSNFCAFGDATADGGFYTVRVLDWGLHRISKLHRYPLLTVEQPEHGNISVNIGWAGFLGAISGMNAAGITLGEMGYGDPAGETLRGEPMPFLLRDVLTHASNLAEVRRILQAAPGTNSYVFLMSDGKNRTSELYIKDKDRFLSFKPETEISDGGKAQPAIKDMLYGGHFQERMRERLTALHGKITPEIIEREIIPQIAMNSDFQNVIYDPVNLKFWVAIAADVNSRAAEQPYTFFDLKSALRP